MTTDIYDAPADVRARLLELAASCVGLSFSEPSRAGYVAALFEDEQPARGSQMAGAMSSCALLVRALWRRFGLADSRLRAPYVPGRVMADLVAMAHEAGAWRTPGRLAELEPGDAVLLTGPEHILVVESVEGDVVTSVDGGQRDERGAWCIKRRVRRVGAGPSLVSDEGSGRTVEGWISFAPLVARFA
jgi:hypothetical protein